MLNKKFLKTCCCCWPYILCVCVHILLSLLPCNFSSQFSSCAAYILCKWRCMCYSELHSRDFIEIFIALDVVSCMCAIYLYFFIAWYLVVVESRSLCYHIYRYFYDKEGAYSQCTFGLATICANVHYRCVQFYCCRICVVLRDSFFFFSLPLTNYHFFPHNIHIKYKQFNLVDCCDKVFFSVLQLCKDRTL